MGASALELDRRWARPCIRAQPGHAREPGDTRVAIDQVHERERHVARVVGQGCDSSLGVRFSGLRLGRLFCQQPEHAQPTLAKYPLSVLCHSAEQAAHPTFLIRDRAVRESEVSLFEELIPLGDEKQFFVPGRATLTENGFRLWADNRPDIRPDLGGRPTHAPGCRLPSMGMYASL